jgi:hypothetical protein
MKIAWKKEYSVIDQAIKRMMLDQGQDLTFIQANGRNDEVANNFKTYLNYIKVCTGTDITECVHNSMIGNSGSSYKGAMILSDGSLLDFENCDFQNCGIGATNNICGLVHIDVNGRKGPNAWGKDIFGIYILKNRILPFGSVNAVFSSDYLGCTEILPKGCSAQYLYQ